MKKKKIVSEFNRIKTSITTVYFVGSSGYANFTVEASRVFKVKVSAYNTKLDMVKKPRLVPVFLDPLFCSVHLINDRIRIENSNLIVEFLGRGPATEFKCTIDRINRTSFSCESILIAILLIVALD